MRISKSIFRSPARIVIIGFASLISIGTILLMFPIAAVDERIGFVNAVFTATSAVCVTGLTVVDTGSAFSSFGQAVILILIQSGGLGIMTLSTLFLMLAGRRPGLTGQMLVQDTFTHSRDRRISDVLRDVILFTGVIEGIGVVILFFCFLPENGIQRSLYLAVFHSVSAFCNAGFSVFSDSFVSYRGKWVLNWVVCFLIVSGGIGFLVLFELKRKFSFHQGALSRLSLHSKLVLTTTAALVLAGMLLILGMEWKNTLEPLSVPGRFMGAFFQSVTARTAGFNTVPIGNMTSETLFFLMLLMFIGASPGSCGGGVKTTSFATVVMLGVSRFRGQIRPQLFRRSISEASIGKAVSIIMLSASVICIGVMLLLMTELGDMGHRESRGKFLELLFEVVSAFGTVGLSTGITPGLSATGKVILSVVMFVGRLGPLVVGVALSRDIVSRFYYAEENIMVG